MKISLTLLAVTLASTANGFMVTPPSVSRKSVIVNDSRKAQKVVSRTKWLEKRGGVAQAPAAGSAAGLMTNEKGLEYVKLVHPDTGATSEVYLYGGVVTSYVADGTEVGKKKDTRKTRRLKRNFFLTFCAFALWYISSLPSDPMP
jgi:hypothetical protein